MADHLTAGDLADMIRHLVEDTLVKLNGCGPEYGVGMSTEPDRQSLLEDLLGRLLAAADFADGRTSNINSSPSVYPLIEREYFGDLVYEYPED